MDTGSVSLGRFLFSSNLAQLHDHDGVQDSHDGDPPL